MNAQLSLIKSWYEQGEVFAYPTEAVFGLGCDPRNKSAVYEILRLKQRPVEKGMILIASEFSQVKDYVKFDELPQHTKDKILSTWPGPVTWLLPKASTAPVWLSGDSDMLAVRLTAHPLVREICDFLDAPLVSTSANPAGEAPAKSEQKVLTYFEAQIKLVHGKLGKQSSPSRIFHSLTMETIRA